MSNAGTMGVVAEYLDALLDDASCAAAGTLPWPGPTGAAAKEAAELDAGAAADVDFAIRCESDALAAAAQLAAVSLVLAPPRPSHPSTSPPDHGAALARSDAQLTTIRAQPKQPGSEAATLDTMDAASGNSPAPWPVSAPAVAGSAPAMASAPTNLPQRAPAASPEPFAASKPLPQLTPATVKLPSSATAHAHRWIRVAVGADSYALELLCVQEVVRLTPIVAMRGADAAVLGVMNLRGRIVPVFDLGLWLNAGRVAPDARSRIVVVERNDELIGVLVSAVEDVVTLGRDRIEPPLPGCEPGTIVGIARVGATPTVLLDAAALYG